MSCVQQLYKILRSLSSAQGECVLATLISVEGSSYRRPGSRILIDPDGNITGEITAGCLEEEIRASSFKWTLSGPCVKEFQTGTQDDDMFGWGSGCKGTLQILFQRVRVDDPFFIKTLRAIENRKTCVTATVFEADKVENLFVGSQLLIADSVIYGNLDDALHEIFAMDAKQCLQTRLPRTVQYSTSAGHFSVLWEILEPRIQLCIFGNGPNVRSVLNFARDLEWSTILCDKHGEVENRAAGLNADSVYECEPGEIPADIIFDNRTAGVVMTHRFADDAEIVSSLLRLPIPYVGLMGGRARNQRLKSELTGRVSSHLFSKLFAPVGLDLGAQEPCEIGLSITSEILATLNGRSGSHFSESSDSIHVEFPNDFRALRTTVHLESAVSITA